MEVSGYSQWVLALGGIEAGPALDGAAARRLAAASADDAATSLAALLGLPAPDPRETKTLLALCRALHFGDDALPESHRQAIHRSARSLGFGELTALFTEAGARRIFEDHAAKKSALDNAGSLGHRTQAARRETNRDRIARLLHDPDPAVIRNL